MARSKSSRSPTNKPAKTRHPARLTAEGETPPDKNDPVLPAVNPVVDDHLTPKESLPFPIVAIGASAGGLEAFTSLLRDLPNDTGMAFVVIQHLSPTHASMLPEILTRSTSMPVAQVEDNMPVRPDHVYVIPPGKNLVFAQGLLQLGPRTEIRGQQRPIDHFMRALAEEHGHKSIGVVLSGTANDGTLGVAEIKAAGRRADGDDRERQALLRREVLVDDRIDGRQDGVITVRGGLALGRQTSRPGAPRLGGLAGRGFGRFAARHTFPRRRGVTAATRLAGINQPDARRQSSC